MNSTNATPHLYLLTADGLALARSAMALLVARVQPLTALTRLRRLGASSAEAAAAWELACLRRRAAVKFGAAAETMYFVREALEQASSAASARYHAAHLRASGCERVMDLCGGIGGDSLAFAAAGLRSVLVDSDPVRARYAAENARACGLSEAVSVVCADCLSLRVPAGAAVWMDPARRADGRRAGSPEEYAPPLSSVRTLRERGCQDIGVKLSPAVDHAVAALYDGHLDFVSDRGECKEAVLWTGALRPSEAAVRAVLVSEGTPVVLEGAPDVVSAVCSDGRHLPDGEFLYEPDPAVIRAHLVGALARRLGAVTIDPQIAYLVSSRLTPTPFADVYRIVDRFRYSRSILQAALTAHNAGRVIVKKRGFPQEPDEVRRSLKLRGDAEVVVVLSRWADRHAVFLCQPLPAEAS